MEVLSNKVKYSNKYIETVYDYTTTYVESSNGKLKVHPITKTIDIQTDRHVPKIGVMLVGIGGNNGSTLLASIEANRSKLTWRTKEGPKEANWFGSITQCSTILVGSDSNFQDVHMPMNKFVPMVDPNDLVVDGWDISSLNIGDSMRRAKVLDVSLQDQLYEKLRLIKPRPSIYDPDFIAENQSDRADNLIRGSKFQQFLSIRNDIKDFKKSNKVDKVIVLWTANTERFCEVRKGLNTTMKELEDSLKSGEKEISPSTIFAMASIMEGCIYINGSPQNTFVPGVLEMAEYHGTFLAGDDFKSGQTKLKSVLVDFLVSAGIKPVSIVSYNHLGNNDGKNLSAPSQFRSKEISKSNVVDDMVQSNQILYKRNEHPDHCVVIKYVPYVGDSKRAMDEYTSEIMMGGHNTLVIHNTCEDSLLATPLILDLIILAELCSRIKVREHDSETTTWQSFHSVLSILSYLCKAPLVPKNTQVVNSLFRQRTAIENILRACIGLAPNHNISLEQRFPLPLYSQNSSILAKAEIKQKLITNGQVFSNGHSEIHVNGVNGVNGNGYDKY